MCVPNFSPGVCKRQPADSLLFQRDEVRVGDLWACFTLLQGLFREEQDRTPMCCRLWQGDEARVPLGEATQARYTRELEASVEHLTILLVFFFVCVERLVTLVSPQILFFLQVLLQWAAKEM